MNPISAGLPSPEDISPYMLFRFRLRIAMNAVNANGFVIRRTT